MAIPKRLQLRVKFLKEDGSIDPQILNLDIIRSISVRLDSEVTEYPTLEGDSISDHMWRKPEVVTITGSFGENGKFGLEYLTEDFLKDNRYSRLENIQNLYERIKDECLEVDILSIFKKRNTFVLQDINWTEHFNVLDYTFTFKKIYKAIFEEIEYETSPTESLPYLDDITRTHVIDTLLNTEDIWIMVLKALQEYGLIDERLLNKQVGWGIVVGAVGLGASSLIVVGSVALIKAIIASATLAQAIPVVGQIIGVALVLVGAIVYGVIQFLAWMESKKYKVKKFKKNDQERLNQFKEQVLTNVRELEKYSTCYLINQDREQVFAVNFNNKDYIFTLTYNELTSEWTMKAETIGVLGRESVIDPTVLAPLKNLSEARGNPGTNLAINQPDLFVYCIYVDREFINDEDLQKIIDEALLNYEDKSITPEKIREAITGAKDGSILEGDNLRNYALFISSRSVDDFYESLDKIIRNAIVK